MLENTNFTKRFLPSQPHPFITNKDKIKLTHFYTQPLPGVNICRNYFINIKTQPVRQVDA